MENSPGRMPSLLRMLVLVLLAGMCYQLGYNSGYDNGNFRQQRRIAYDAAMRDESAAEPSLRFEARPTTVPIGTAVHAPVAATDLVGEGGLASIARRADNCAALP